MAGIAVDRQDRVHLFTRSVPPVQVYDVHGKLLTSWGADLTKTAHQIKIDAEGNIWLAAHDEHVVRKCTPEGKLLLTLGEAGVPGTDQRHFNRPTDVAFSSTGDIYVTDGYGNSRVVQFDKSGQFIREWGGLGGAEGEFDIPHAIAIDSTDRVYVADRSNARIQVFDAAGKFLAQWRDLIIPWGFCMTASDQLWVCGSSPMRRGETPLPLGCPPKDQILIRFDRDGKALQLVTVPKGSDGQEQPGECNWLHAVAQDRAGNLYVGDIVGKRAQKLRRIPGDDEQP